MSEFRFYSFNNGKTNPTTDTANLANIKSGVDKQAALAQASTTAQGTDNNIPANAQSGVRPTTPSPASTANNGVPVKVDLDRIIPEGTKQDFKEVGTTVNVPNPITGTPAEITTKGTPSIINDYWLVYYHSTSGISDSERTVTNLGKESKYKGLSNHENYKDPTTSKIIEVFNGQDGKSIFAMPEKKYTYSDFLYLKNYHPYNNNRLITLRRFLVPVYDNCRTAIQTNNKEDERFRTPISKAISYLGTSENKLSTLTNFTVTIKTKDVTGNLSDKPTMVGASEFANLKAFVGNDKNEYDQTSFGYALMAAMSGANTEDVIEKWNTAMNLWETGPYTDLIYGPVNVITGAKVRDRGLTYTHALNLNFEYSTKYIERINPKAAILDIVANMLSMSYHHANFFGGENRFQFDKTNFAFLNNEKQVEFLKALGQGGESEALKKYADSLGESGKNVLGEAKKLVDAFSSGEGMKSEAVQNLVKNAQKIATALHPGLQKLNKTVTEGTKSTLNGSPTGEWHLQVGNPFAPIMMLGNLWCTSATFTFNDDLSADDFPTELKVAIKLEYGRQRDSSDIQSMFNAGGGRIYYPYKDKEDANISSTFYNTEYIYNDKPSENKDSRNQQTVTKENTQISGLPGVDNYGSVGKLASKTNTSNVALETNQMQNQSKTNP